jgi:S-adenosylmethionine hydrolase
MFFVAPDNGVLTLICKEFGVDKIYEISNKKLMRPAISQTFHGRDMMAPVAAHLSLGIEPTEVGKELESVKLLEVHPPRASEKEILGHILHVDDFGNLVTNIDAATISKFSRIGDELLVEITGKKIRMKFTGTFGDVRSGRYLCYVGSSEMLEMAKNMGNLAKELKVKIGAEFRIIR